MQIRVDRLRQALELLEPAVPRKPTLAILKNVLLKDGKAISMDLEKCIVLSLPEVTGELLIPHHEILELLKHVPGNETLTIEVKDSLVLSWDGGQAGGYSLADPRDYPPLPEVKVAAEGDLDGDMLTKGLLAMVPYTAGDDKRPVLSGVSLYLLGQKMALAAGDGFRMGYQELPLSFPVQEERVLDIPAGTVEVLAKLWKKAPAPPAPGANLVSQVVAKRKLRLSVDGDKAAFNFGRVAFIVKLIEGTPPKFKDLIPASPPNKVRVMAPDFLVALRRIQDVAKAATGIARLKWADSGMTVSAKAEEKGSVESTIPAVTDDGPGRIAINIKYLQEYLAGKEDFVEMGISSDKSPVLFKYRNSPVVVIMPMFVQDW